MASEPQDGGPCMNTDRHLWPETSAPDAERESIHVTAQGAIGINVGGFVYVKPLREWHKLAGKEAIQPAREVVPSNLAGTAHEFRDGPIHAIASARCITIDANDVETGDDAEVCLDMSEARAFHAWLGRVLGAGKTAVPAPAQCCAQQDRTE